MFDRSMTPKLPALRFVGPALHMLLALLAASALAGCNINPNATPIVMFPSPIPAGTKLPTYAALYTPGSANPTAGAVIVPPNQPTPVPTVTFIFVSTPVPPTPAGPTAIPTLDANWTPLTGGIDWRRLSFRSSDNTDVGVLVVRIDPSVVTFKVIYKPGESHSIQDWQSRLPGAVLIVNASFFDTSNRALGLVAVDGVLSGASFPRSDTGLFQVQNGAPRVRSLYLEPYNNAERFDQAVQGFPMLVVAGQVAPGFEPDVSQVSARRTVLAMDRSGRILFIVTPFTNVKLADLAGWLGVSGLDIDAALNVDGGNSTCLYMATGGPSAFTLSLAPVPVVLAVYPR
jgi:uncharacterized protein YigE (DUF2233 family)